MRKALVGGAMAVLVAAGAVGWLLWLRGPKPQPPATAEELSYRLFLQTTASGHGGKVSGRGLRRSDWAGYAPYCREGALQVHAGLCAPAGRERRAVFLLLYRLDPNAP
ncbi:MAG: hypothetical protein K2W96_15055, partial [Gemmataceae bacterium]|nr:hypothetical protein [Gemmataceae bacterium]